MATLAQLVFNGLSSSSVYALVAIGITLIFGLTGIVNFAHGQMLMLGAYVAWLALTAGANVMVAFLLAAVTIGIAGVLLERAAFQWTLERPITGFIVSLGLIPVIHAATVTQWGTEPRTTMSPLQAVLDVAGVRISLQRVFVMTVAAIVIGALFYMLRYTHLGRSLRAAAEDRSMTALLGIPVRRLITSTFALGSAIAGLGGAVIVSMFPVTPELGSAYIFKAFAIALIGGLGNVAGAVFAAIIVGIAESLAAGYLSGEWTDAYVLSLMMVILMIRPTGLLRGTEGSSVV